MSNHEKGEHSRKSETNDDEKPLKKARYVWEVKGKYHLKESYKNNNSMIKNNNTDHGKDKNENTCDKSGENSITLDDIINNSVKKPNESCSSRKCCIQSFLAKTDSIMDTLSEKNEVRKKYIIDASIAEEIPVTLVSPKAKNQDYYLRKWQARQIARGFVDNTINSVLETWINPPFDAADFVENCANDGRVEDDAILMAIQSHGLQTNSRQNNQYSNTSESEDTDTAFVRSPGIEESTLDNFENYQNELIKEQENISNSSNADSMSWDSSNSNQIDDGGLEVGDPMDFLNAAVAVAIQKKGLSYGY